MRFRDGVGRAGWSLAICALSFTLVLPAGLQAQAPAYRLQDGLATGKAIPDVLARSKLWPLNKRYEAFTPEEKERLKSLYTAMEPGDEPPFPARGLDPYLRALSKAQEALSVRGDLYLVVDVDESGDAQAVTVYGDPDPQMTKFAAQALMLEKFKPARCAGQPCAQKFPFALNFVVRL